MGTLTDTHRRTESRMVLWAQTKPIPTLSCHRQCQSPDRTRHMPTVSMVESVLCATSSCQRQQQLRTASKIFPSRSWIVGHLLPTQGCRAVLFGPDWCSTARLVTSMPAARGIPSGRTGLRPSVKPCTKPACSTSAASFCTTNTRQTIPLKARVLWLLPPPLPPPSASPMKILLAFTFPATFNGTAKVVGH